MHTVKHNETIKSIAKLYNNTESTLKQVNRVNEVEEGDVLLIRQKNQASYVVKPLDTLNSIAIKFGVSINHLKEVNNIEAVFIGQQLII